MSKKVYVTDFEFPDVNIEKKLIENSGAEFFAVQCTSEEDVIKKCSDAYALINQYAPISSYVMKSLPNLRIVSRYGVGVNTIDVKAATELGIAVTNVPDANIEEVSDHALSLLLCLHRKIKVLNKAINDGEWSYKPAVPIRRLKGMNLGLLSFGHIAQKLAQKTQGLGLRVMVYDPYVSEGILEEMGVMPVALHTLFAESDFISIHTPLNQETFHMIGEKELKSMKKTAYLINTSRGPIIDEKALIKAIHEGWIAGAALDVLEQEPLVGDHPLKNLNNVILTPHSAWYTEDALLETRTKAATNIVEFLSGDQPKYWLNKKQMQALQ